MTVGRHQDRGALLPGTALCEVASQYPGAAGADACCGMQGINVLLELMLLLLLQLLGRPRRLPKWLSCLLRCIPHTINSSELGMRPGSALKRCIAVGSIAVVQRSC